MDTFEREETLQISRALSATLVLTAGLFKKNSKSKQLFTQSVMHQSFILGQCDASALNRFANRCKDVYFVCRELFKILMTQHLLTR